MFCMRLCVSNDTFHISMFWMHVNFLFSVFFSFWCSVCRDTLLHIIYSMDFIMCYISSSFQHLKIVLLYSLQWANNISCHTFRKTISKRCDSNSQKYAPRVYPIKVPKPNKLFRFTRRFIKTRDRIEYIQRPL